MDFTSLTDAELGEMLLSHGVDIGPINTATRRTYERKLEKLKTGQIPPPSKNYEPVEDDEENSEVELRIPQTHRQTPAEEPTQPRLRKDAPTLDSYIGTPRVESRPSLNTSRKTTLSEPRPGAKQNPASGDSAPSKGLLSWVKLVALIIIVILVYLIYSNMEPQAVSNIPKINNKVEI